MERDIENWKGCSPPEKKVMEGRYVRLEPLNAEKHGEDMYKIIMEDGADKRLRYFRNGKNKDRQEFQKWMEDSEKNQEILFFSVIDKATGKVGGRQTFSHINAAHGTVEIGGILRGLLITKKPGATEAVYLFLRYIFDELGYRRFQWKCHVDNQESAKAALRYGFKYEALFRNHFVINGENRDSLWFSIIDREWPPLKVAFEQWLCPENFNVDGVQKRKLEYFQAMNHK